MSEPSASDLQALAQMRFEDASLLLEAGRYGAAYYLAGYSVECALKARIVTQFRSHVIPNRKLVNDIYTHDLSKLLSLAGLMEQHRSAVAASANFSANWSFVVEWDEGSRYDLGDPFSAHRMIAAVGDEANGILPWLKQNW